MNTCPICQRDNHHLAVTCANCGSFLQGRIENLDLFSTLGHLIESPFKTFHSIAIARHKNYVFLLSAVAGIPVVFTLFWIIHAGEYATSFLNLLIAGFATGPAVGLTVVSFIALLLTLMSRIIRSRISFYNSIAVVAYSCTPVIYIFIFVFPVIFLTFGIYFFTLNPSPALLRPFSYYLLLILYYCLSAWALVLFLFGIKVASGAGWRRALLAWGATCVVAGGVIYGLLHRFIAR